MPFLLMVNYLLLYAIQLPLLNLKNRKDISLKKSNLEKKPKMLNYAVSKLLVKSVKHSLYALSEYSVSELGKHFC